MTTVLSCLSHAGSPLIILMTNRTAFFIVGLFITGLFYGNIKYGVPFWDKHNIVSKKNGLKF